MDHESNSKPKSSPDSEGSASSASPLLLLESQSQSQLQSNSNPNSKSVTNTVNSPRIVLTPAAPAGPNHSPTTTALNNTKQKLVDELELELGIIERGYKQGNKQPKGGEGQRLTDVDLEEGMSRGRGQGQGHSVQFDDTITEHPACITFRQPYPNTKFFLFTFILGFILALFGIIVLYNLHFQQFGFYYAFGSAISCVGMIFLEAVRKQVDNLHLTFTAMCVTVMVISFLGSYISVVNLDYSDGAVICFIFQYCALASYAVYYIPSAQNFIKNVCDAMQ